MIMNVKYGLLIIIYIKNPTYLHAIDLLKSLYVMVMVGKIISEVEIQTDINATCAVVNSALKIAKSVQIDNEDLYELKDMIL